MDQRAISEKLSGIRVRVIRENPFFGRLLLKLRFGIAECTTAFTDMRRIVFDPSFVQRLSDEELKYVMVHEVLHCALKHCTRGAGKQSFIYNVACDIVTNSLIIEMYNLKKLTVEGEELMHLAPDGHEGREYTAEVIYDMLMGMSPESFTQNYLGVNIDTHTGWEELDAATLEDLWQHHLKEASRSCGTGSGIPSFLARYLKEIDHTPNTNWRQILHDFIQFDKCDYDFARPDKRYSSDVILPSFCECDEDGRVEKVWFLVDTSGSVSDEAVSAAYEEIKAATEQISNISGTLSFFDQTVSEPEPFSSLDDILSIKPIGGGGTSFAAIFEKLDELCAEGDAPCVIVIITDGYDTFPDEEAASGIPVIWIIADSDVVPPWGGYAFISTD